MTNGKAKAKIISHIGMCNQGGKAIMFSGNLKEFHPKLNRHLPKHLEMFGQTSVLLRVPYPSIKSHMRNGIRTHFS